MTTMKDWSFYTLNASLSFPFSLLHFSMASRLSLKPPLLNHSGCVGPENRQMTIANMHQPTSCSTKQQRMYGFPRKNLLSRLLHRCYSSSRRSSSRTLSSTACRAYSFEPSSDNGAAVAKIHNQDIEFNRVNCLVWVLHESARSFSLTIELLDLTGSSAGLAMAWSGKDIHAWQRRLSYQVALYALLKTAIEVVKAYT